MKKIIVTVAVMDLLFTLLFIFTIHSEHEVIRGLALIAAFLTTALLLEVSGLALIYSGSRGLWRNLNNPR